MEQTVDSLKKTARLAGWLYCLAGLTGAYSLMYVPQQIFVRGDSVATVNNLLAKEFIFRTGIVSNLISSIAFIYLALVLYRLFKKVNEEHAKLLVAFVVVYVSIVFLAEAFNISSLMIAKGRLLKSIDHVERQDVAMLFFMTHNYGMILLEVFMGLWLIPFGQLVYKSGFIPRILGVLLIIAGVGYIIDSLTFMLFPKYVPYTQITAYTLSGIAEFPILMWLLIKGVKVQKLQQVQQ